MRPEGGAGIRRDSVHRFRVTLVEQLFHDQGFEILVEAPQDHQYDDLELVQRNRIVVKHHCMFDDQFAETGRDDARRFKKDDETQTLGAEPKVLLGGIHPLR